MEKWHLLELQPRLQEMFKEPLIISYERGSSLRDILVKAKLWVISLTLHVEEQLHSCDTFAGSVNGLSLFIYHPVACKKYLIHL